MGKNTCFTLILIFSYWFEVANRLCGSAVHILFFYLPSSHFTDLSNMDCSVVVIVQCPVMSNSLWPHGLQHARPPCPSPSPRDCPSSCSLHLWSHPAISSSNAFFSFCPPSFPASVLPVNIQGWSPLRLTGLILLSKGLLGVFSSTTVRRHQFFGSLPSLLSTSHNHRDHWGDRSLDHPDPFWQSNVSALQHTV